MNDLIQRIGCELTRTEEVIRNRHHVYGFSRDNIKVELSEESYAELTKGLDLSDTPKETIFGFKFEVKQNLDRDFAVFIDSFHLK